MRVLTAETKTTEVRPLRMVVLEAAGESSDNGGSSEDWGVFISELSTREILDFKGKKDHTDMQLSLVLIHCVNEEGEQIYSTKDQIKGMPCRWYSLISTALVEGITPAEVEKEAGED